MNAKSSTKSLLYRAFAVFMITMLALAAMPASSAFAAPSFGFIRSVTLASQVGTATYGRAGTVTFDVVVTEIGPFHTTTRLVAVGLPVGATATFSPDNPIEVNRSQNVTVTVHTSPSLLPGSTAFHIHSNVGNVDSGNRNLTISKATPFLLVTNTAIYDGTPKAATVTGFAPGVGSISGVVSNILTGGSQTKTNAGTYTVTANFVPNDTSKYNSLVAAAAGPFVISKATPTLSVTNSPVTYDGAGKAATVTGSVPGVVSSILTGGSATETNVGTYAVTANFVPTDTANNNSLIAAAAGNFVINKGTPTLSVTNSPATYDGFQHVATVTGSVPGVVSNVLTGGSANQTNAANYTVSANFVPTDTTNYKSLVGASAGNFLINKAASTTIVSLGGFTSFTYDRSAHAATVVVSGAGGLILTPLPDYSGSCSAAPTTVAEGTNCNAGYFYAGDANHTSSDDNKTIMIIPAGLTVSGVTANNKVYDGTTDDNGFTGGTLAGIIAPDVVSLDSSGASGTFNSKDVGTGIAVGNISGFGLTGTDAGNYILSTQPFVPNANITPASLTVSGVTANNKVYDRTTADNGFTGGTLTGLFGLDNVVLDSSGASGTFASANVGTGIAVSATGFGLVGAQVFNYILSAQPTGLTADITPKALTITGLTADDKVYDGNTDAALSGTAVLSGVITPDIVTLGGIPAAAFAFTNAASNIPVIVSGFTLVGVDSGNYILTQPAGLAANISKATPILSVTNSPVIFNGFQQEAVLNNSVAGVINAIRYNGLGSVPTNIGIYAVTADFVPTDTTNYNSLNDASAGDFVITD